jgi:hypothetical protein
MFNLLLDALANEVPAVRCDKRPAHRLSPAWWHDWQGRACAIVASGPSARNASLECLKGRLSLIAIKETFHLCPWADVVFGCDGPWWKANKGLPEFKGTKLSHDAAICAAYPDVHKIEVIREDRLFTDHPGTIGYGRNSGFMALNLAVQFGARRILLIGFDLHADDGIHWYGPNAWRGATNPGERQFRRWRDAFAAAAPQLKQLCIDVVNASSRSALTCFRRQSVEATLKEWEI